MLFLRFKVFNLIILIQNHGFKKMVEDTSIFTDNIYQSFLWSTGNTFSSTSTSVPGNFWVTVTDQFGCSGTSDTLTIANGNFTFDLLPADSIFLCNAGSSVTLDAANSMNVSSYQWNTGATTPTITTNTPGTYYCITTTSSSIATIYISPHLRWRKIKNTPLPITRTIILYYSECDHYGSHTTFTTTTTIVATRMHSCA